MLRPIVSIKFMKIINRVIQIIFITLFMTSNAQKGGYFPKFKNNVKFSPVKLIDIVNPGFEFGYERYYSHKFSTQINITKLERLNPFYYSEYSGYKVSIQQNFFVEKLDVHPIYLGIEPFFWKADFKSVGYFGKGDYFDTLNYNYFDSFSAKKIVFGLNLKIGIQLNFKRFLIDAYCGLGLKRRTIVHYDRINPIDVLEPPRHFNAPYEAMKETNDLVFNLPCSIKLGFLF